MNTDNMKKDRLWTLSFILICLGYACVTMGCAILNSSISLYVQHLGGKLSFTSILATVFGVSAGFVRFIAGYFSDRGSRRWIIYVGILLFAAGTFFTGIFPGLFALVFFRFIHGCGHSAAQTSIGATIADILPDSRMNEGIGYYSTIYTFASAFSTTIVLSLLGKEVSNFKLLFIVTGTIIAAGIIMIILCRYEKEPAYIQHRKENGGDKDILAKLNSKYKGIWKALDKRAVLPSFIYGVYCFVYCYSVMYLAVYAIPKGFTTVGIFFTISAAALLVTRLVCARIESKVHPLLLLLPGFALMIIAYAMIAFTNNEAVFLIASIPIGISYGMSSPTLTTASVKRCPSYRFGASSATYNLFIDFGMICGGFWGIFVDLWGFKNSYILAMTILFITGIYTFFSFRKGMGYELSIED